MKSLLIISASILLAACNALGGIPSDTVNSIAQAGGGCVKVTGVYGTGIIIVGSTDKGVIRNGEMTVAGDCGGITIRDQGNARAAAQVPGTVTTTTVPGQTTTTVAPPVTVKPVQ